MKPYWQQEHPCSYTTLRRMAGAVYDEALDKHVLRSTEEARQITGQKKPVLVRVRDAQMKWAGHVARGSACLAANCALNATSDGGRARRGAPKRPWAQQIDGVALALDCEDWQVAAQDREEWKAICAQARDLPDPWTQWNEERKEAHRRRAARLEDQEQGVDGEEDVDDPQPV